jgi:glutathione peroxidase
LKDELPGLVINDIKWNFTKFLLVNGVPFKRYATIVSPSAIESDIVEQLAATTSSSSTTATDKHQEL